MHLPAERDKAGGMSQPTTPRAQRSGGRRYWTSYWYHSGRKHIRRFGGQNITRREALARYQRWLQSEFLLRESVRAGSGAETQYSCRDLARDYLSAAQQMYRKHERPTSTIYEVRVAMTSFAACFGSSQVDALQSQELCRWRDSQIIGPRGRRSVRTVRGYLRVVQQAIRWARERGLISRATALDLRDVSCLTQRDGLAAPRRVMPVSQSDLQATLLECSPVIEAMARTQLFTGMRPGEVCLLRSVDIEMGGEIWIYTPREHKTEHRGRIRRIALGPKAQAVIRPFLATPALGGYIFRPGEAEKSTSRGERYTSASYRRAIRRACERAGVEPWHPNQLRHNHATEVRGTYGLEAARDVLGHSAASTTEIYAERSLERAKEVARRLG